MFGDGILRVWGLGLRVRVWGLGVVLGAEVFWFGVSGLLLGFGVSETHGSKARGVSGPGMRLPGSGFAKL